MFSSSLCTAALWHYDIIIYGILETQLHPSAIEYLWRVYTQGLKCTVFAYSAWFKFISLTRTKHNLYNRKMFIFSAQMRNCCSILPLESGLESAFYSSVHSNSLSSSLVFMLTHESNSRHHSAHCKLIFHIPCSYYKLQNSGLSILCICLIKVYYLTDFIDH